MTDDLFACVGRSIAAERAGEAAEALEWHRAVPMYRRGRHCALLDKLARVDGDLPPWVWARWMVYQACRCEGLGTGTGRLHREVLDYVLHAFHADLLDECYDDGGDPIQVMARVLGESWAFHQVHAHELGGLVSFIDECATGRLAEHAELARSWADTPLSGYRVGDAAGGLLAVEDLAHSRTVEVLDLGAASCAGDNGFVLGRLVPSGTSELLVFDTVPLAVPAQLARAVAAADASCRWAPITEALASGQLDRASLLREDYELTTDVPELELVRFGTAVGDLGRVMAQLREGRDEVGRAAFRILRRAAEDDVDHGDAAYVGAAVQHPHAQAEARRRILRSGQHAVWTAWAALVAEPARSLLLGFAEAAEGAA